MNNNTFNNLNNNNNNNHHNLINQNNPQNNCHQYKKNNQLNLFNTLNEKTLNTINTKYNNYIYLDTDLSNKEMINLCIKKGIILIYIRNNRIKKGKVSRVLSDNIIELSRGKKIWFIYLNKYIIYYKKENTMRSMLEDIINNRFTIDNI